MGTIEAGARKVRRRGQVQQALLLTLLVGGMVAIGAVPYLLPRPGRKKGERQHSWYVQSVARRLVQDGLAQWIVRDGKKFLRITQAGQQKLALQTEAMKLPKKRRWDRRWRMVAFDLPERRRGARNTLRSMMTEAGFVRLQDSVWVYPYDCEEFVALLKAELKMGKDVLYAVVEQLENDKGLREHFNLPLSN